MRLHEPAVKAAAESIKLKRYLAATHTDEDIARLAIEVYKSTVPHRGRVAKPRPRAQSRPVERAAEAMDRLQS